jgi:hypothetical protein
VEANPSKSKKKKEKRNLKLLFFLSHNLIVITQSGKAILVENFAIYITEEK